MNLNLVFNKMRLTPSDRQSRFGITPTESLWNDNISKYKELPRIEKWWGGLNYGGLLSLMIA
jgi:hypothetical protein